MSSRDEILQRLRQRRSAEALHPGVEREWTTYEDPLAQFSQTLQLVGGTLIDAADETEAARQIAELEVVQRANSIYSADERWLGGTVDLDEVDDPHDLALVDICLAEGDFWVAENGAVWVPDRKLKHRAILFLAQHLVLVVPREAWVSNMHQAYARLAQPEGAFGVFISGPSKTADIEQSLVIGAHGARSLHVLLVG